jgi:thiol-disulfide isomerase/thioredoxin
MSNVHPPAKAFIDDLAESLEDPLARATARYFSASYLIQSSNQQWIPEADRLENQERALAMAKGLSAGIEKEAFILTTKDLDGTERSMTFADAEAELLYSLESTTVGQLVSDVRARRLDGTPDALSDYAGRVVLVDFWATWCAPCLAAFPKLRELTTELPRRHFQIIGVNVDSELETAADYLDDNPLPWVVWHVGDESEIVRKWRVTGFPTYVLIDPDGMILARNAGTFNDDFRTTIEQAVGEVSEPATSTP